MCTDIVGIFGFSRTKVNRQFLLKLRDPAKILRAMDNKAAVSVYL